MTLNADRPRLKGACKRAVILFFEWVGVLLLRDPELKVHITTKEYIDAM